MTERRPFIAVIDDDERMCQALGRLLRVAGYEVEGYFSAEAFLDDPNRDHAWFVVADIQLRGISGLELAVRLRREPVPVSVVLITAHDDAETRAQASAAGCAGYFRKPTAGAALLKVIRASLAQRGSGA